MRAVLFVLLLFLTMPILAQTPDTTSAERYFPLEVGNEWRFVGDFFGEATYWRYSVSRDTIVDGVLHFVFEWQETNEAGDVTNAFSPDILRFDPLTTEIRMLDEPFPPLGLVAECPLGADFGASTVCNEFCSTGVSGEYGQAVTIRDDVVVTTVKSFDTSTCESINFLAAGIGPVGAITNAGSMELHYARIGDVEYGDPVPVATESALEAATVALTVFPNPSRGTATASLRLDRPQRVTLAVFDVLGRRVLTHDLGVQPVGAPDHRLDVAALPSGVYVVRLDGDAGAQATARIVRH